MIKRIIRRVRTPKFSWMREREWEGGREGVFERHCFSWSVRTYCKWKLIIHKINIRWKNDFWECVSQILCDLVQLVVQVPTSLIRILENYL